MAEDVPHALRRAKSKKRGGSKLALKEFACSDRATESDVRHELHALNTIAERGLPCCMPGLGAYFEHAAAGIVLYYLAMPCACSPCACRAPEAPDIWR